MCLVVFLLTAVLGSAGQPLMAQERGARPAPSAQEIRDKLGGAEFGFAAELIKLGENAFPAYEEILKDPMTKDWEAMRIFVVLRNLKADRRQFIDLTVRWLSTSGTTARSFAVELLKQIGSRRDTPPVVALLWDREVTVVYAAAEALAALGGEHEVTALDIWIQSDIQRIDTDLRRHVQQCRDALQRKVEEQKKKAGG